MIVKSEEGGGEARKKSLPERLVFVISHAVALSSCSREPRVSLLGDFSRAGQKKTEIGMNQLEPRDQLIAYQIGLKPCSNCLQDPPSKRAERGKTP